MEARPAGDDGFEDFSPAIGEPLNGVPPGKWNRRRDGLPEGCPVTPLGIQGKNFFFLDHAQQFYGYKANDFNQAGLETLFGGDYNYLCWAWPRWGKPKQGRPAPGELIAQFSADIVGYDSARIRPAMMAACKTKGIWNGMDKLRGRGAWKASDGRLLLHCGNVIVDGDTEKLPDEIDGCVYPALGPLSRPWPKAAEADSKHHGANLLKLFRQWNFKRKDVDPVLLLGAVGVCFLGGALEWRSATYLTGDTATGKSTLLGVIESVLGDWAMMSTNTTAAGIYQNIGFDATAVILDELEAAEDNRKMTAIIELMRQASSGGLMFRGGGEHQGVSFTSRSAFIFASINPVPLESQDFNRMALLQLQPLPPSQSQPVIKEDELALTGRIILKALADNWHRFDAVYQRFAQELAEGGHNGRGQKTFGTLLTCASLIVGDKWQELDVPLGDDLTPWRKWLRREALAEYEDALPNWQKCLNRLLTVHIDKWSSGMKGTIGKELEQFYEMQPDHPDTNIDMTNGTLSQAGCRLVEVGGVWWLAVPNQSTDMKKIFEGSQWVGGSTGSWGNAIRQWVDEDGSRWQKRKVRVNGATLNCTLVSLDALYGDDGVMTDCL